MNVGLLLQYIEHFLGVCSVVTNLKAAIDEAFFYRFGFVVEFEKPDTPLREQFWALMLPKECPLAPDISIPVLAAPAVMRWQAMILKVLSSAPPLV